MITNVSSTSCMYFTQCWLIMCQLALAHVMHPKTKYSQYVCNHQNQLTSIDKHVQKCDMQSQLIIITTGFKFSMFKKIYTERLKPVAITLLMQRSSWAFNSTVHSAKLTAASLTVSNITTITNNVVISFFSVVFNIPKACSNL